MVSKVFILNPELRMEFYVSKDVVKTATKALAEKQYRNIGVINTGALEGSEAAEEVFDLTNNPNRQQEREERYGRHASVSVGDIVQVGDSGFLCASVGWIQVW
jgi:hypothetical protein